MTYSMVLFRSLHPFAVQWDSAKEGGWGYDGHSWWLKVSLVCFFQNAGRIL